MRINFAEVEAPEAPKPLPAGWYNVICTGVEEDVVGNGPNKGAPLYKWEFTVQDGEHENFKVWDNMSLIAPSTDSSGKEKKGTYWRAQQLLNATGIAADDDLDLDDLDGEGTTFAEHVEGYDLQVKVDIRPARTNPETGQEYKPSNQVKQFKAASSDGSDLP